jgi:predicted SAM-dependent methyltransferase
MKIHLGCGDWKVPGFENVDTRQTSATDVVHDCRDLSFLPNGQAEMVFSHAFFEHLKYAERPVLLKDINRVLAPEGLVVFMGLPNFRAVAEAYLKKAPNHLGRPEKFDLWQAYRYTHGAPEDQPTWWLEQLHKTLFDVDEIERLLCEAGFGENYCIFEYCWDQEANPVSMGFIAAKNGLTHAIAMDSFKQFVDMGYVKVRTGTVSVLRETYW